MGIAGPTTVANKRIYKSYLDAFDAPGGFKYAVNAFFAKDAKINIVHPFNELAGPTAYYDVFLSSLQAAFNNLYRRNDIVFGGEFDGSEWVTSTGYYVGHMCSDWLGMPASNRLTYLRFGEFHRIESGRAVETYIFLDLPELMIDLGVWPITQSVGFNRFRPGPATHDGVNFQASNPEQSANTLDMVQKMLIGLNTPNKDWEPYWDQNMVWYGPAAFGAYVGREQFESFQVPFEKSFEGWSGGLTPGNTLTKHSVRTADGNYACLCGWPSVTGTHVKTFLDQPATGKRVFMRVSDWWRRDEHRLMENWVIVDVPHLLQQLGADLFDDMRILQRDK